MSLHRSGAPPMVHLPPPLPAQIGISSIPLPRPNNPRTQSASSIISIQSLCPSSSSSPPSQTKGSDRSSYGTGNGYTQDEIEDSLRQWRNHVFPSLKAGNYVSPGLETPDREQRNSIFIQPLLPSIFNTTNIQPEVISYATGRDFLHACTDQHYFDNWRLEMVLGQTQDDMHDDIHDSVQHAPGVWLGMWSGSKLTGTRLLEFCLMKLPSRPLVLSSPIPISLLPTQLLQDRLQRLLSVFLAHPSVPSIPQPFSLIMGPVRLVDAFLHHYNLLHTSMTSGINGSAERTTKPLCHTRANTIPPAVSLSEGFAVRLADDTDDLAKLASLFQAYSATIDHFLDDAAARRALTKAMLNSSVWIYYLSSASLPGLSIIAGFLTTERVRRPPIHTQSQGQGKGQGQEGDGAGRGSAAITAVFTAENYARRGVAESLIRTATRHYLADQGFDSVSVYIDPRNESTCRLFARVGFGIAEQEEAEEIQVRMLRECLVRQADELDEVQAQVELKRSQQQQQDRQRQHQEPQYQSSDPSADPDTSSSSFSHQHGDDYPRPDPRTTARSFEKWQVVALPRLDTHHPLAPAPAALGFGRPVQGRMHQKRGSTDGPWR
ncbi:MAG: hypothetical protein CYPHOPRED_005625 [Cyphobasidiales sp. Tagirdzhanova-0007]|nr:MAG: hypothetical protein CYPHOPRED_005625 [Cyphobasidiales sp. Tagirdzhanova-0007]